MSMGLTSTLPLYLNVVLELNHPLIISRLLLIWFLDIRSDLVPNHLLMISILEILPRRWRLALFLIIAPWDNICLTASLFPVILRIALLLIVIQSVSADKLIKIDSIIDSILFIYYLLHLIDFIDIDS